MNNQNKVLQHIKTYAVTYLFIALMAAVPSAFASYGILSLPADTRTIDEEAFMGDTSLNMVVIPEGATRIQSRAYFLDVALVLMVE